MTDSMKFGPEWLRNMKSGDTPSLGGGAAAPAPTPTVTIKMAEFRYGREEMLALFNLAVQPPDPLKQMQGLYVEKSQMPLALVQMSDEETTKWNRGINSDINHRLSKPGPGVGMAGTRGALGGRGGSVDRGRGRARGSYHYSRGLSYEETDTINGYNPRGMRNYERTQSQGNWGERNGGDPGDYTATSPRKEFGGRSMSDTNWRRQRAAGEEDEAWRTSRTEKWGRGGNNSWREGEGGWDRSRPWDDNTGSHQPHPPRKPWEAEENNLPEWAMENPSESGGSFDASGAFHGGTVYSDEEEGACPKPESLPRTSTDSRATGSSQPRPGPAAHREPPNITNGASHPHSGGGGSVPLRQSQSASSLASERRPNSHPITSSASFSGLERHNESSSPQPTSVSRTVKEEPTSKAPVHPTPHPPGPSLLQLGKPTHMPPALKIAEKSSSQEEEIEQRLLDAADVLVSRLMDEEEREPHTAPPNNMTPPTSAPVPVPGHSLTDALWYYQDPQGNVQGPFQSSEMYEWYTSGYFKGTLLVRRACDERYSPLSELMKLWKGIPFILDYYAVPPINMMGLDKALLFELQHRVLMQRQALAKMSQTEHINNLSYEQQQLLLAHMQLEMSMPGMNQHSHTAPPANNNVLAVIHHLAQQQQQQQRLGGQVPVPMAVPSPAEPPTSAAAQLMQRPPPPEPADMEGQRNLEQFMNSFRQRYGAQSQQPPQPQLQPQQQPPPLSAESVWGGSSTFPAWSPPPGHHNLPQSLWADPVTKGIKTEQEILEEQLRIEEKKREELRKQEELQRLKEEEERQKRIKEEEELERRRKEEEEKEREKERKRIQEEEERKKKEAAAAKKAEQDRLRKEEEKKRKEEEKRRKEEEKRKQEEEKKKLEEEKKRLEEERKKREEVAKRQNEALKRLQEQQQQARAVKTTPVPTPAPPPTHTPWSAPDTSGASLADIQKTERKQQQQLREQQEMLKAYQEKHQQEQQVKSSKSGTSLNLKWAEGSKNQPARVKSLAEIQAEEHERLAKQAEKDKAERMAAAKEVVAPAANSIWASANNTLSWSNAGSVWGTSPPAANSVGGTGARFWDEKAKPATKPAASAPAKSQAKTKAKKEEASVMKLFEKQIPKTSKSDDFNKWCTKTLSAYHYSVDIPTFVDFLLAFESHKEVREYIRMYLGETKEANDFASEFIDRRSRLVSPDQAPATQHTYPTAHSNHFQEVKGKNKKVKKNKMTKVDSRILGFNVTAAPDRINVGDRDYGEGL